MKHLLFFLLLWPMLSIAQVPKPMPNTYINDLSGSLSADQIRNLNIQIRAIETAQDAQIAVVLVHSLPANLSIEEYAMQIGRTWHVGNNRRGLVYVAAIDQHKQRLEIGTGLEGTITDIQAKELTDNIKAFFRSNHYYEGISTMLTSINTILKPVDKAVLMPVKRSEENDTILTVIIFLAIGMVIGILSIIVQRHKRKVLEAAAEKEKDSYVPYDRKYADTLYARGLKRSFDEKGKPGTSPTRPGHGKNTTVIAPVIINEEPTRSYNSDSSLADNSSSSSSSSGSSDYGSWGSSDSSSSSSSDSFSGGGSSNDW